jgi:hypothetical protein
MSKTLVLQLRCYDIIGGSEVLYETEASISGLSGEVELGIVLSKLTDDFNSAHHQIVSAIDK